MNEQTNARIAYLEAGLAHIEGVEAILRLLREHLLNSDPEYAAYVENYRAYYDDEPLPIRRYYELAEELDHINAQFTDATGDAVNGLWLKHHHRIEELERLLCA